MSDSPWSKIASSYAEVKDDVRQWFLHPALLEVVKKLPPHGSCLDFGCGPGDLTVELASLFGEVVAVDRATAALDEVRRRLGFHADVIDPTAFAARRDTFDVIVLSMVMTTIETDDELGHLFLTLSARLELGGRLIIGTTHPCFTFRALAQVHYASSCAPYRVPIAPGLEVTEYHRSLERVIELIAGTGLRIVEAKEVYDDPEYYRSRGEEPHRFAGVLPMFMVLTCEMTSDRGSR